jgi:hypothetical protein
MKTNGYTLAADANTESTNRHCAYDATNGSLNGYRN